MVDVRSGTILRGAVMKGVTDVMKGMTDTMKGVTDTMKGVTDMMISPVRSGNASIPALLFGRTVATGVFHVVPSLSETACSCLHAEHLLMVGCPVSTP
jgi:hypothetical protein